METIKKINVNKLSNKKIEELQAKLQKQMELICKESVAKANKILNEYGLEATIRMDLKESDKSANGP